MAQKEKESSSNAYLTQVCSQHNHAEAAVAWSGLWGQAGVEVGNGSSLNLVRLTLDVVAGDLLGGLADGDWLCRLAADVNGLALLLGGHCRCDGQMREGWVLQQMEVLGRS